MIIMMQVFYIILIALYPLTVLCNPIPVEVPGSVTTQIGCAASFRLVVHNADSNIPVWTKSGYALMNDTRTTIITTVQGSNLTSSLTINPTISSDVGLYGVSGGGIFDIILQISLTDSITISSSMGNLDLGNYGIGQMVLLPIKVQSCTWPSTLECSKDGEMLLNQYLNSARDGTLRSITSLIDLQLDTSSNGQYLCTGRNELGNSQTSFNMTGTVRDEL